MFYIDEFFSYSAFLFLVEAERFVAMIGLF